jgi:peptidoglycan hydrolase-like protein with peptidoglycan-binding domain
MKKLVLTTASVLALGIAGIGSAQTPSSSPNAQTPSPSAQTPYASPNAQSPSPSAQTPSSATMSQGSQGQSAAVNLSQTEIQQLQQQLKGAGLYRGSVDGEMGPETKQAISQFQQQHGLNQTGVVDQQTLSALSNNQSGAGSSMGASGSPPSGAAGNPNPSTAPNTTR